MPRKRNQGNSNGGFTHLSPKTAATHQSELPAFDEIQGFGNTIDLLMRAGVYIGFQRGNDGAVVGITVLDGADKKRAWCHSVGELRDALIALATDYGEAEDVKLVGG